MRTNEALLAGRGGGGAEGAGDPGRVGSLIRARRGELGLTLRDVAGAVGCAVSYLSAIETGQRTGPAEGLLERLEGALRMEPGRLVGAGAWGAAPPSVRREVARLRARLDGLCARDRAAARLAELVRTGGAAPGGPSPLDEAFRSGELRRLVEDLSPEGAGPMGVALEAAMPREVPLINRVAAGYPTEFTDLGYPARVADEYIRCPDLDDPDAFAARVVGDSMLPDYREGDIVVFSPARGVRSGQDCFVRLERGDETTFKRIYFEEGEEGQEMIRLQPLNSAYRARVVGREAAAGLYAAVSVTRAVGTPE